MKITISLTDIEIETLKKILGHYDEKIDTPRSMIHELLERYRIMYNRRERIMYNREELEELRKIKIKKTMTKYKGKAVIQYDLKGKKIAEYVSMREAERQTGIRAGNISACCCGLAHTAGGYIWKLYRQ